MKINFQFLFQVTEFWSGLSKHIQIDVAEASLIADLGNHVEVWAFFHHIGKRLLKPVSKMHFQVNQEYRIGKENWNFFSTFPKF